jgi:hypothetical protein
MKADVVAFKPSNFYAVYIGFRCVYDPLSPVNKAKAQP